jgi:calcium/calmodulin-dependent protein kinase I
MFSNKNDLTTLKIADFGLATHFESKQNLKCGTVLYMAPEIFDKKSYDISVDIWASGFILYILCSGGRHP